MRYIKAFTLGAGAVLAVVGIALIVMGSFSLLLTVFGKALGILIAVTIGAGLITVLIEWIN